MTYFFILAVFFAENRLQPIYDFGYVAMNFQWVYPEDSGEYVCVATNLYGRDETRATIKTTGKPSIIYDSQLPPGMHSIDKIREMEATWLRRKSMEESERAREAPAFVTKPEVNEVWEGDWAKFCCRVTGFPRPRVLWIVNGRTVMNVRGFSFAVMRALFFSFPYLSCPQIVAHAIDI